MLRLPRPHILLGLLAALLVPVLVAAQPGAGAPPGGPSRAMPMPPRDGESLPFDVTQLLNARRELDLTPRQVMQLDSIERVQFAQLRQMGERMRVMRDSMLGEGRGQGGVGIPRDSMRARAEAMRPQMEQMRTRDSLGRVAAQRVLTDAQRQKVREMQAEERGRMRGMREARMGGRGRPDGRGGMRRPGGRRDPDGMRPPGRPMPPGGVRRPDGG